VFETTADQAADVLEPLSGSKERVITVMIEPDVPRILAAAELVTITERIAVCRDPTDDKFLELAVNRHADLAVSGDSYLLALHPFRDIPIVTPAMVVQGVGH
jgi:uncharacterized protein